MTDREWDKKLGIQTCGRADEKGKKYMPYEPTPYSVLLRLYERGIIGPEDHLLDYGCGKGRAVFFMARQTLCRASGVDYSPKLIAMARENQARFSGGGMVEFICDRAEAYQPREENVFFFFNPFSRDVLEIVLRRILGARKGKTGKARLVFYYPTDDFLACLEEESGLMRKEEIDCRDLFDGNNPQEKILVYETEMGEI